MNSNLEEILRPSCQNLKKKLIFFSIFEQWPMNNSLPMNNHLVINTKKALLQKINHDLYYHSLLHIFTCISCFRIGHEILKDKVHPSLSRIMLDPPGMYIDVFIEQKKHKTQDLKAYYFCLFWEKINQTRSKQPAIITFEASNHSQTEVMKSKAAGISDMFPDRMPIPIIDEKMYLCFENDATSDELNIMIVGGTLSIREKINVELVFICGEKQILNGKDIAIGGMWSIPNEKATDICLINFYIKAC